MAKFERRKHLFKPAELHKNMIYNAYVKDTLFMVTAFKPFSAEGYVLFEEITFVGNLIIMNDSDISVRMANKEERKRFSCAMKKYCTQVNKKQQ